MYGVFLSEQHKLIEVPYPAHPYILEKRAEMVNAICFYYPQILKNEIEYLHRKIHNIKDEDELTEEEKLELDRQLLKSGKD